MRARANAARSEDARLVRGVDTLFAVKLRPTLVVVVNQWVEQCAAAPRKFDNLMHLAVGVIRCGRPAQEPQLIVGRETAGAHFVTDDEVAARRPVSGRCVGRRNRLAHFGGQRRRCALVGVHKENPLSGDAVERGLALRGIVVEGALHDQSAGRAARAGVSSVLPESHTTTASTHARRAATHAAM
jgi:hypothetical protein